MPHTMDIDENSEFDLDYAANVLQEADQIKADIGLMTKIENRLQERQRDFAAMEDKLFGTVPEPEDD